MTLAALLLFLAAAPSGRIAGVVSFKGRAYQPVKVPSSDPACKNAVLPWEPRALVRIAKNIPPFGGEPPPPLVIEEKACVFRPWLAGAVKGQPIVLRNADGTTHSVRASAGERVLFNVIQPANAKDLPKDPVVTGPVKLGCDLHPWMAAHIVISEHPFFSVTDDAGAFAIDGVPPGTYGVEAYNPKLGTLKAEVTVEDGKAVDPKFSFSLR